MKQFKLTPYPPCPSNILYELENVLGRASVSTSNSIIRDQINQLLSTINKTYYEPLNKATIEHVEKLSQTIGRFWKVTKICNNTENVELFYIYPYKLNHTNNMLFALVTSIDDLYLCQGSMIEKSISIENNSMFNDELLFQEVSRETFLTYSQDKCKRVLDKRNIS